MSIDMFVGILLGMTFIVLCKLIIDGVKHAYTWSKELE